MRLSSTTMGPWLPSMRSPSERLLHAVSPEMVKLELSQSSQTPRDQLPTAVWSIKRPSWTRAIFWPTLHSSKPPLAPRQLLYEEWLETISKPLIRTRRKPSPPFSLKRDRHIEMSSPSAYIPI